MSGRIAYTDGQDKMGWWAVTWSEMGIHTGVAVRVMLINLTAISTGFWKEGLEGQIRVREWLR